MAENNSLQGSNLRIEITKLEDETAQEITVEDFKKIILCKTDIPTLIVSKPEMDSNEEKRHETT